MRRLRTAALPQPMEYRPISKSRCFTIFLHALVVTPDARIREGVTRSGWREYQNLSDNSACAAEPRREGGCPQPPRYVGGGSDQLPEDSRAAEFIPWLSILIPANAAAEDPSSQNFVLFCDHAPNQILTATDRRSCYAVARQPPSLNRWNIGPFQNRVVLRFFSTHLWLHPYYVNSAGGDHRN